MLITYSLAKNHITISIADQNIEHRLYLTAAPNFVKFQSDAVDFAKLAKFFALRMDDIRERREALCDRVEGDLKQAQINLAIKKHILVPPFPRD